MSKLITREQLIRVLQDSGRDVTERMVRYWESKGIIDHSTRLGQCVYYDDSIVDQAKLVFDLKNNIVTIVRKHRSDLIRIIGVSNEE